MKKINIQKLIYVARKKYFTLNHIVVAVALLVATSWMWGALDMMQRNYSLQREVDTQKRQLQLVELQRDSLALQKRYYQTREYQELVARESLGLVMPGEKVLIIPKNLTESGADSDSPTGDFNQSQSQSIQPGNMQQWFNFLFGGNSQSLNSEPSDK